MPRDFPKLLREIKAELGLTNYKLGVMLQRDHSTVEGWEKGTEPKHSDGEVLIAMHDLFVTKITANSGKLPISHPT